jgi:hypothetical protein
MVILPKEATDMQKVIAAIAIVLAVILLFPLPLHLNDGGTVIYQAVLYSVSDVHTFASEEEMANGKEYDEGIIIKILGFEILNTVQ